MSYKIRALWAGFSYFQHQIEGINWMLDKEINGTSVSNRDNSSNVLVRGGFQCDDMGLGKTIQITSVIVNNPKVVTLLIAPLAMIDTWSSVLQRAGCAVYEVAHSKSGLPSTSKSGETDVGVENSWKLMNDPMAAVPRHFIKMRPSVYISNYEKLYHNSSLFSKSWDRVVLDEAHKIRNGDGEVARACRKIIAPIRWAVTGTPLVNSLQDVVSLLAFIGVPYSKLWRWEPRYLHILPEIVIHRSLNELRKVIKDAPPIPEINEIILPFTTKEEEEFYFGVQALVSSNGQDDNSLLKKYSSDLLSSAQAFKLLLRLRQISVHPQVYINAKRREDSGYSRDDWTDASTLSNGESIASPFRGSTLSNGESIASPFRGSTLSNGESIASPFRASTKLDKIKEIISQDDDSRTHKYIVFCQFNDEMSMIRQSLLQSELVKDENILMYNGSMNQKERSTVLAKSKETNERTVLLLQLQAGGVGLNLQEYDRIIFVSPWWTSALMDQAIARAVRMGQKEVVKIYHLRLAAEHEAAINIDELVNAKAEEKRKMLEKLFALCSEDSDDSDDE
jgi:transcription termination factor 2